MACGCLRKSFLRVIVGQATFEDALEMEAVNKKHSLTCEAVEVGFKAKAYRTVLTHFSQRYPKIPVIDSSFQTTTCIAFDLMTVNLVGRPLPHRHLNPSTATECHQQGVKLRWLFNEGAPLCQTARKIIARLQTSLTARHPEKAARRAPSPAMKGGLLLPLEIMYQSGLSTLGTSLSLKIRPS